MDQFSQARAQAPQSLEALLDEENKEVLASLKQTRTRSPVADRNRTPPPYKRSMLDLDLTSSRGQIRHSSIAGIGVGITDPRAQSKPSSRLNPADPSTWTRPHATESPKTSRTSVSNVSPARQELPKIQLDHDGGFEEKYNFDMAAMPSTVGTASSYQKRRPRHNSESIPIRSDLENMSSASHSQRPEIAMTSPSQSFIPAALVPDSLRSIGKPRTTKARSSFSEKPRSLSGSSDTPGQMEGSDMGTNEDAIDGSSEEGENEDEQSSEEDGDGPAQRSRGRTRAKSPPPHPEPPGEGDVGDHVGLGRATAKARESAAEQSVPARSLLQPQVLKPEIRTPAPEYGRSGPTAEDFEDEDDPERDIQRAKTMGLAMSEVDSSIPGRHVRMVIRGEWARLQEQAEEHNHTSRLYFACSDLSTEASYAMEWTVGTMLRDGDTLLVIHAIEDESAPKEVENNRDVQLESEKAAHEAEDTMKSLTRRTTNLSSMSTGKGKQPMNKFLPVTEAPTSTGSVDARNVTKKEMDRLKAMDLIMQEILKLVRKTTLQVRCMVEVIHCKSPKHLLLNAIDTLDPTLCVVGTRGRNSLKGVLLGSISNYLVTKSSVPVMVARKRLKKPRHAKVNSSSIRLTNNLIGSRLSHKSGGLADARID